MLRNSNIEKLEADHLYHFALDTSKHDLPSMFGDVKFVLVGGSHRRIERTAQFLMEELDIPLPTGQALSNIASATDRYALFKVGPVLLASHGMGMPSASIMLHEMIKLVYHAGCLKDVIFIRIGTCGGLGLDPGTVVISESALDGTLEPYQELAILGEKIRRPAILDKDLAEEILSLVEPEDDFQVVLGKTMCTDDFYEGQGRLDGAICHITNEDKMKFLKKAYEGGVKNIEMESLCFAAMCHHTGIKSAVVCVAIVNRFKDDQVTSSKSTLTEWEWNPVRLVCRLIRRHLNK